MWKSVISLFLLCFALSFPALSYVDEVNPVSIEMQHYRSNYFLFDLFETAATSKLQVSFKTRVFKDRDFLYFGYTQLMFWQLRGDSQPFYDLNYNPEFFSRWYLGTDKVGLDFGFEHESNGVDGPDTRSWHRIYLRFFQEWPFGNNTGIYLNFKLGVPFLFDPTNMDIAQFRGLYEIHFMWIDFMNCGAISTSDLNLRLFPGGKSLINPLEGGMDLTLRFKTRIFDFTLPMFVFQIFWGHAECLKDYNAPPVFKFRWGLGF
ncbi:MAG TPA: phospholipase A [Candidatus Goldiibacteriota bacterium]|nr:phospholipase A [Candidatus Goldiibacteriota bacterium]